MADVKRSYRSGLRQEHAARTRGAVLAAALDLFVEQGYAATTIDQVAERAGVSKPTVFTAVGNKQQLLSTVRDVAMAGDDRPIPVAQREGVELARAADDAKTALDHIVRHIVGLSTRYAAVHEVLRGAAAADAGLRELWETSERQRHRGAELMVGLLRDKGPLRRGRTAASAADILDLYMDPSTYTRFVTVHGWSVRRYRAWLAETLADQLLG